MNTQQIVPLRQSSWRSLLLPGSEILPPLHQQAPPSVGSMSREKCQSYCEIVRDIALPAATADRDRKRRRPLFQAIPGHTRRKRLPGGPRSGRAAFPSAQGRRSRLDRRRPALISACRSFFLAGLFDAAAIFVAARAHVSRFRRPVAYVLVRHQQQAGSGPVRAGALA